MRTEEESGQGERVGVRLQNHLPWEQVVPNLEEGGYLRLPESRQS